MPYVSVLVDVDTNRVLVATTDAGANNLVHSVDGSTLSLVVYQELGVGGTSLLTKEFPVKIPAADWCEFVLDRKTSSLRHSPETPVLNPALRQKAELSQAKVKALGQISNAINRSRRKLRTSEAYGDITRMIKKDQALKFRASGYEPSGMSELLFVWQFAEIHGTTPRAAADQIILEAELFEGELWKSEGTKMKYHKAILACEDVNQFTKIISEFHREFYVNAVV